MVTDNGNPVPVEAFFDNTNTLVMRGQDFELNLAGQCDGGCDLTTDSTGRQVLQLQQDGNALVGGFGFMPGTLVHVWVFSEPTYLGALTVAANTGPAGSLPATGGGNTAPLLVLVALTMVMLGALARRRV